MKKYWSSEKFHGGDVYYMKKCSWLYCYFVLYYDTIFCWCFPYTCINLVLRTFNKVMNSSADCFFALLFSCKMQNLSTWYPEYNYIKICGISRLCSRENSLWQCIKQKYLAHSHDVAPQFQYCLIWQCFDNILYRPLPLALQQWYYEWHSMIMNSNNVHTILKYRVKILTQSIRYLLYRHRFARSSNSSGECYMKLVKNIVPNN